jgi:hypothetical protein
LNGTIVALINCPTLPPTTTLKLIPSHCRIPSHELIGLGIIRSIDTESKTFHIITPESPENLECVNLICRGQVDMPHALYSYGDKMNGMMYCTALFTEGIGANVARNRHIQRRPINQ